jgi:hypothetical protein
MPRGVQRVDNKEALGQARGSSRFASPSKRAGRGARACQRPRAGDQVDQGRRRRGIRNDRCILTLALERLREPWAWHLRLAWWPGLRQLSASELGLRGIGTPTHGREAGGVDPAGSFCHHWVRLQGPKPDRRRVPFRLRAWPSIDGIRRGAGRNRCFASRFYLLRFLGASRGKLCELASVNRRVT